MRYQVLIITFLISITSIAQNKKSFLRDGNESYKDSSYNKAEIQYRKSLEKDQDYYNASFNLADAIYKQERYAEASALFNALKDNAPTENDLAKIYHNLGNSLFEEQKIEEAINAYKNSLRINPNDNDTRHNLALSIKQQQNQEQQNQEQQNQEQQNQEQQNQEQQNQEQQNQEQQNQEQQKEKKEELTKETAKKMLEAIQEKEKEIQEKLQKKKIKGKKINVLKDW